MVNFKHGYAKKGQVHRLHKIWRALRQRCSNVNNKKYSSYGGRGIKVSEEWSNNFECFKDWAEANGYDDSLSIDRIDNDGDYCSSNCRWATVKEQARNRRTNAYIEHEGVKKTIAEWAEITGIGYQTLRCRLLAGYPVNIAFQKELPKKPKKEYIPKPRKKAKGYWFDKSINKYRVETTYGKKKKYIGLATSPEEARRMYVEYIKRVSNGFTEFIN